MSMLKRSLVFKLWLAMVILVVIVLWVAGFTHINIIEDTYYKQQIEQLRIQGERVAGFISENPDYTVELNSLSETLGVNIMQVNRKGLMEGCHGLGLNLRRGKNMEGNWGGFGRHGVPWPEEDIQRVLEGETLYYRGPNNLLNNDVLSVAVPVKSKTESAGAVIVSAPLAPIANRVHVLQMVSLYTGIGGIFLATLLSLLFSRKLSRPLIEMNKAAKAMAEGNFSNKVDVAGEDEVGLLGTSLNNLSRQLQDKIKDIERMDQTRRDFVANVSHELRTPLSIIQGYSEALADGMASTEEERKEYLENVQQEVLRLRRLVNDLLDLRKIETGQAKLKLYPVELSGLMKRVADHFRGLARKKNIHLDWHAEDGLPLVFANEDRLEQVLINLVDNGLRVTPEGGSVVLGATNQKNAVKITVKDTGPGIPDQEKSLIWERFYKVDKSRTRESGGTGLGLAIAKRIVEAHGGEIDVHCPEGGGTVFNIFLSSVDCC